VALVTSLLTDSKISSCDAREVHSLPPSGIGALSVWLFTVGIGDEIGWRGYALPRLRKDRSALHATDVLAFSYAFGHLPQFFSVFDPQQQSHASSDRVAGLTVLTWFFSSAGGSILVVAVFHGCFDYISLSGARNGIA